MPNFLSPKDFLFFFPFFSSRNLQQVSRREEGRGGEAPDPERGITFLKDS